VIAVTKAVEKHVTARRPLSVSLLSTGVEGGAIDLRSGLMCIDLRSHVYTVGGLRPVLEGGAIEHVTR
jgi:hypothetical protein